MMEGEDGLRGGLEVIEVREGEIKWGMEMVEWVEKE